MKSLRYVALTLACVLPFVGNAQADRFLSLMDNEGHYDSILGEEASLTLSENNVSGKFLGSPWQVAMSTGTDNTSLLGVPSISIDVSSTAERAGVLFGVFSVNDLWFGEAPQIVAFGSTIFSVFGNGGVDWQVCVDSGNVLGAFVNCTGFQSASLGDLTFMPSVTGPFSLTIATRFTASGPARFNVTASATDPPLAVPEPGTVALLALGLLGMSIFGVRRQRQ